MPVPGNWLASCRRLKSRKGWSACAVSGPNSLLIHSLMKGPAVSHMLMSGSRLLATPSTITIVFCSSSRCGWVRSEEHTSELQSLMRISYAVFCLKNKKNTLRQIDQHEATQFDTTLITMIHN